MEELTFVQANQPQPQDQPKFEDQRPKQPKYLLILKNRLYQLAAFFTIFAFVIPFLFYYIFFDLNITYTREAYSCFVNTTFRVPCKSNISRYECLGLGCCFDANTLQCYHSYPSRYNYHLHDDRFVPTTKFSLWATPTKPELKMSVIELDANRVQLVVYDPLGDDMSWEEKSVSEKNYYVKRNMTVLSVDVQDSEGQVILTTGIGPLIASDGYWEWTFRMTDDVLFGLDEFYFEDNVTTIKVIHKNRSNHTTVPVFMAYLRGGFHGLVVENPGPMELIILPSKLVSVRSLAGSYISLTLTTGPTPKDVVDQLRTYEFKLPPQWILGPHICRDGTFNATVAVDEYQAFLGNANNTVNYASDCFHENLYFEYLQSLNVEEPQGQELLGRLLETLSELQNRTRLLLSFQPQIVYDEGNPHFELANELDLLYRNADGEIFNGTYLSRQVAYPDLDPSSTPMVSWLQNILAQMQVENIAGFALKDNWPAEDTFEMEGHASLPYLTEELRSSMSRTLQWNSSTPGNVQHIELHNNYGGKQVELFREAIQEDGPVLFTSSYNYGIDAVAQMQNVNTSWSNLARVIRATLSHSILAHPLISAPVCGSTGNYDDATHESLCIRWYITAATLPIFRVSSELPRRDPASLPSGLARAEAIKAIETRDTVLPYYYTVLSRGEPLTRPMLYDFYDDRNTFALDQQYMVGDALLVAQPLLQHTTSLRVYLPPQVEVWYEFFGGLKYEEDLGWIRLSARETDWFVFIMQGKIVPLRRRKVFRPIDKTVKIEEATQYTYSLAVALNLTDGTAEGSLFLTATYLEFIANGTHVQIQNISAARTDINCDGERLLPSIVESVQVYGVESRVLTTQVENGGVDLCDVVGDTLDIPLLFI